MKKAEKYTYSIRSGTEVHEQATIFKSDGTYIECDKGIADTVCYLNHNGFETTDSCEDDEGKVFIIFREVKQIKRLFQVALDADPSKNPRGRKGLMGFLKNKSEFRLTYGEGMVRDKKQIQIYHSNGSLSECVILTFERKYLANFQALLKQVLAEPNVTYRD